MKLLYRVGRSIARGLSNGVADVRIEGLENVPGTGPFVLVPNHLSILDPFFVQGACPRAVYAMTKSTQFASPFFRFLLPRLFAFPVRRYRVDPQAVRVVLRRLEEGEGVCIYPEGERSWDGTLQPFRQGALRVLLRTGVPIVPVGLDGCYDVWPRWRRRPRRGLPVVVRFGEPIVREPLRTRVEREAALAEFTRELRERLLELSGEASRDSVTIEGPVAAPQRHG